MAFEVFNDNSLVYPLKVFVDSDDKIIIWSFDYCQLLFAVLLTTFCHVYFLLQGFYENFPAVDAIVTVD
jgi:hypothetical protein